MQNVQEKLRQAEEMWRYLGFEPWEGLGMQGIARKITLVKDSLMGPVAKYYAWDYIVWEHQGKSDVERLFREWKGITDVVTQRFLMVGLEVPRRRARGFLLGFKGFLELYAYLPGGDYHPKVKDLIPPINKALELH